MAVKIGKALGAHVTVVSRNNAKRKISIEDLKADNYVDMSNSDEVAQAAGKFDMIINTISAKYDFSSYLTMLKVRGKIIVVGAPPDALPLAAFGIIGGNKTIAGSLIGGTK